MQRLYALAIDKKDKWNKQNPNACVLVISQDTNITYQVEAMTPNSGPTKVTTFRSSVKFVYSSKLSKFQPAKSVLKSPQTIYSKSLGQYMKDCD